MNDIIPAGEARPCRKVENEARRIDLYEVTYHVRVGTHTSCVKVNAESPEAAIAKAKRDNLGAKNGSGHIATLIQPQRTPGKVGGNPPRPQFPAPPQPRSPLPREREEIP